MISDLKCDKRICLGTFIKKKSKEAKDSQGREENESGKKMKMEDSVDLASTLQAISRNFGAIFQDMDMHFATVANAWSYSKERKQKLDDKSNKVLEEVMKIDGISPFKALEVVTILIVKEHKLRVFYQALDNLRK